MRASVGRAAVMCGLLWGCHSGASEPDFAPPKANAEPVAKSKEPAEESAKPAPPKAAPAPAAAPQRMVRRPSSPDPVSGDFSLKQATEGLPGKGPLKATINTSEGELTCTLFEDKAPLTVANFVGLARGKRPFWDAREAAWVKRPLYDDSSFHRVIPGFMIQGGDYLGDGTGEVGFTIDDELHPSLQHDRAGLLCMANKGPNTNGGQFFITDAAAPHLTRMKSYTIFGECSPTKIISKIANAPKDPVRGERPNPPVAIRSVRIER